MCTLLLLGFSALAAAPSAGSPAELDIESPYAVTVCVRFTSHPIFTPLFVDSIQQQLDNQLNDYLKPLANVSVRLDDHWLIDEHPSADAHVPTLNADHWERLAPDSKVFLLVVDYADGFYELKLRELDVVPRRSSRVQRQTTPDRQWVPRAAGLAIQRSFALAARVRPIPGTRQVGLDFRGGEYGGKLAELMNAGGVLQPYRVIRQGDAYIRVAIPGTLLRVNREKGLRRADVFSNQPDPWKRSASIVGFEAYGVKTRPGRLRLQVVDAATGQPAVSCYVSVNDQGFDAFRASHSLGSPDPEGQLTSGPLQHLAFLQVTQENSSVVRWPLPITEPLEEHTIKVYLDRTAGEKNRFQRRLHFAVRDLQTLHTVQTEATGRLNTLSAADSKRYEEALELAQRTLDDLAPLLDEVERSTKQLEVAARELDQTNSKLLAWLGGQLEQVQQKHADLLRLRQDLATAIDTREAAKRAQVTFELGRQAESEGEIEQAIRRYEAAVQEFDDPKIRRKLEQTRRIWQLGQAGDHQRAHRVIYEQWATAEVANLRSQFPEVVTAFQILKDGGDPLRARKLLVLNGRHIQSLSGLLDQLAQRDGQADRAEFDEYSKLVDQIAALQQEVGAFIKAQGREAPRDAVNARPESPASSPASASPPATAPPGLDYEEEPPVEGNG